MNHALLLPHHHNGFSPLNFGSDLALWLDPSYGVYTDRSTQLTAASSQCWSRPHASAGSLDFGDTDFWGAAWVYADTLSGIHGVVEKGGSGSWTIYYVGGQMYLQVNAGLINVAFAATGTWVFLFWYHDAVNNTINISKNGGAFASAALSGGPAANADPFQIGRYASGTNYWWDGRIDSVVLGQSPVGGIAALATTIRDFLYNSGSGRVSSDVTDAQKTAWGGVSAYDFDGDGLDAWGSNDLTAVNSPTYTSGIASGVAGDGDVVSLVDARTGPNCGPPSYAGRPLWVANAGKPYFSFDGTNDGLQTASNISLGAFTIAGNFYASGAAGMLVEHSANAGTNDGSWIYGTTMQTLNASRSATVSTKDLTADWAVDSTWRTIVHTHNGTHATNLLRLNGVNQTLSDVTSNDVGTGTAADKLNIGARNNGASLPSTMRLGDLVAVNRVLTAGELAQLESWLASRRAA